MKSSANDAEFNSTYASAMENYQWLDVFQRDSGKSKSRMPLIDLEGWSSSREIGCANKLRQFIIDLIDEIMQAYEVDETHLNQLF